MPGAASPEEAVFTGVDDPTASPVAQEFIKKLQSQGLQPTAANMRRLVEANARNISQDPSTTGPDPVPTVRNDRIENSARPAARRAGPVNPPMVDMGATANEGPGTNPGGPAPFVDPATGILMTDQGVDPGTAIGPALGSAIVAGLPFLRNLFGRGGPNLSGVTLNPTPGALPAPPPVAPPQIAAPQAQLPAPQARLPAPQQALPAPPTNALPPGANAPPSVIRMPAPPAPPVSGTTPTPKALLDILSKQRGMRFGAGIPFIMESPQDIMSRWKK